jgi:LPS sulfotransferase NodH
VRAAVAAGTTANGVFAARLMWGTLDEVVDKLRPFDPDPAGTDIDLLGRGFGRTRYVYLHRADVLAQAVSWLRAEQTDLWSDSGQGGGDRPEREPRFDFDGIHGLVQLIEQHNAAWRAWFAAAGVRPHPVRYEDLDADPVGVARGVLDFLGLELLAGREIAVRHRRLADELNARWIDRYQAELVNRSRAASGR